MDSYSETLKTVITFVTTISMGKKQRGIGFWFLSTDIRLYLSFPAWFRKKRNSVRLKINQKWYIPFYFGLLNKNQKSISLCVRNEFPLPNQNLTSFATTVFFWSSDQYRGSAIYICIYFRKRSHPPTNIYIYIYTFEGAQ